MRKTQSRWAKTHFTWAEWQWTMYGHYQGIVYCENLFHLTKEELIWFKLLVRAADGGELLY